MIVFNQKTVKERVDIFIKIRIMRTKKNEQQYKSLREYMRDERV